MPTARRGCILTGIFAVMMATVAVVRDANAQTATPIDGSSERYLTRSRELTAAKACPPSTRDKTEIVVCGSTERSPYRVPVIRGDEAEWTCPDKVESFSEMKGELDDQAEGVYAGV